MPRPTVIKNFSNVPLDILGQQPMLRIYTQICLCYPFEGDGSHVDVIFKILSAGLDRLTASFPWVAGKLVDEDSDQGKSGIASIEPCKEVPLLMLKLCGNDSTIPTMDALRKANFPMSMLDERLIASQNTIPGMYNEGRLHYEPVFQVQANVITGGLLLTITASHACMDMTGQGQVINLLSKACRDEPFTDEELSSGNLDRQTLIPLRDDSYKLGPEHAPHTKPPPQADNNEGPSKPTKETWASFTFSSASLATIKSIAMGTITSEYVSTDDAISAFVWQSVGRARLPRLGPSVESTFGRAVDVRRYLHIPQTYAGLMQHMTFHKYTLQKLVESPLGIVASNLRTAVDPKTSTLAYDTRALATRLERSVNRNGLNPIATMDLSKDMLLSSWAKLNCYELDFGLGLGKPEYVQRPLFIAFPGLSYILPRMPDGGMSLAICLQEEDLDRLKADEQFAKYARYEG